MLGIYVLCGFAALMLVAAVFIYSNSEGNSFEKLLEITQETKGEAKKAVATCSNFQDSLMNLSRQAELSNNAINNLRIEFQKVRTENEILVVRQHTLEKRLASKERNINLRLNNGETIPVEILQKVHPKGQGATALLKRAGVAPEVTK